MKPSLSLLTNIAPLNSFPSSAVIFDARSITGDATSVSASSPRPDNSKAKIITFYSHFSKFKPSSSRTLFLGLGLGLGRGGFGCDGLGLLVGLLVISIVINDNDDDKRKTMPGWSPGRGSASVHGAVITRGEDALRDSQEEGEV